MLNIIVEVAYLSSLIELALILWVFGCLLVAASYAGFAFIRLIIPGGNEVSNRGIPLSREHAALRQQSHDIKSMEETIRRDRLDSLVRPDHYGNNK
jgi:hypothetical protein